MERQADVLIAGGGPAGSAAALTLARAGFSVALAESLPDRPFRVGESLPPAARPLLRDLGLLDVVTGGEDGFPGHPPAAGNVSCWGSSEPRSQDFLRDPHGPGWHLDRTRFDAELREEAVRAGIRLLTGARVLGAEKRDGGGWRVRLVSPGNGGPPPSELTCRFLIDATGRRAALARGLASSAGGGVERLDGLFAWVGRFRPDPERASGDPSDEDTRTWIEATPDGWWYASRLPDGSLLAAFHSDPDLVDAVALSTEAGFLARLLEAPQLTGRLAHHGYRLTGSPRGADAGSRRLVPPAGEGWLAVGDAALAFDPLSSQGIFNALYTGLRAGEAAAAWLGGGSAEGTEALAHYAARMDSVYRAYLAHRRTYYAAETRWPERELWWRRTVPMAQTPGVPRPASWEVAASGRRARDL